MRGGAMAAANKELVPRHFEEIFNRPWTPPRAPGNWEASVKSCVCRNDLGTPWRKIGVAAAPISGGHHEHLRRHAPGRVPAGEGGLALHRARGEGPRPAGPTAVGTGTAAPTAALISRRAPWLHRRLSRAARQANSSSFWGEIVWQTMPLESLLQRVVPRRAGSIRAKTPCRGRGPGPACWS